jgi:hypothetical protein
VFADGSLWQADLVNEVHRAFVEHPDIGDNDFMTKLKGQMSTASSAAQQLMSEMLRALLLFPSNMKPWTKSQQVRDIWDLSGQPLTSHAFLEDEVLIGIGSGGMGFHNYRPDEMMFLIALVQDLKARPQSDRRSILSNYETFVDWIAQVPQKGDRQFRHMLRFSAFTDVVERISSNNDRVKILVALAKVPAREIAHWTDRQLDDALVALRAKLQTAYPSAPLDFYEPPLREQWLSDRTVRVEGGEISVTVPTDEDEIEDQGPTVAEGKSVGARQSIQIQSRLAIVGAVMGFRIWIPRADRGRVLELVPLKEHGAFLGDLPLNYDNTTLDTVEQIDVLWLKGRAIARAFEVEHTAAVCSGLLRMADLLALQPKMDIRLHIVAPDERREKVFREMRRPVFSLLDRGPLSRSCTFISYESVEALSQLEHLAHTNDSVIAEYEEKAELKHGAAFRPLTISGVRATRETYERSTT